MWTKLKYFLRELSYNLGKRWHTRSLVFEIPKNQKEDTKMLFEKDILNILKRYSVIGNGKGIQKINILCSVECLPEIKMEVAKY